MAKKTGTVEFECVECGWSTPRWAGRCGRCGKWDCLVERAVATGSSAAALGGARLRAKGPVPGGQARPIESIAADGVQPWPSGIGELDRVLGGGIVPGAVILLAGEPGVGKSTLLLDVAARAARAGRRVLYATGEESTEQVRLRAERIGALAPDLFLVALNDLGELLLQVESTAPDLLLVDSVQTFTAAGLEGTAGGVTQVRGVAALLVEQAKTRGMAVVLVGHVTKDGAVAGPRTLEHVVDVVCSFEGERHTAVRLLRASKNRHGPADEVGCFTLHETGITAVADPSGLFIQAGSEAVPGTCLAITMEGRRPLAVEVQSLVMPSNLASPRRTTSGVDSARLAMILAVLQRRCGIGLSGQDVYASTVGGARLNEPGVDLAVALACASGRWSVPLDQGTCAIGEVGLGGEVRPVRGLDRRLAEAARLGLRRAIVPATPAGGTPSAGPPGLDIVVVANLGQAVQAALAGQAADPEDDPNAASQRPATFSPVPASR